VNHQFVNTNIYSYCVCWSVPALYSCESLNITFKAMVTLWAYDTWKIISEHKSCFRKPELLLTEKLAWKVWQLDHLDQLYVFKYTSYVLTTFCRNYVPWYLLWHTFWRMRASLSSSCANIANFGSACVWWKPISLLDLLQLAVFSIHCALYFVCGFVTNILYAMTWTQVPPHMCIIKVSYINIDCDSGSVSVKLCVS
jgi:hypothetical protein